MFNQSVASFRVLEKELFIQQKKHFGGAFVNTTHSTVHVPTIIYSLSKRRKEAKKEMNLLEVSFLPILDKEILLTANWSYNLNQAFIDNYDHDPELTWQYFCSQTGLYRVWPGHIWEYPEGDTEELDLFDCRVQNWYIRATSSPRDVIILIDASGSMTGLKKSIAIQTVETILDTLSDDDFVQIIKVSPVDLSFPLERDQSTTTHFFFSFKKRRNSSMIASRTVWFKPRSRTDM